MKQYARILGPKGLMPNVKSGTLVKPDVLVQTVKESKQGLVEFRITPWKFLMNKIGPRTFKDEDLERNLMSYLEAVARRRPESVKGRYFEKATVKTTMGIPVKLNIEPY